MINGEEEAFIEQLTENVEASYFLYKICEGCDRLVMYERAICPNCNAYRFDTKKKNVVKSIKKFIESERAFFIDTVKDFQE